MDKYKYLTYLAAHAAPSSSSPGNVTVQAFWPELEVKKAPIPSLPTIWQRREEPKRKEICSGYERNQYLHSYSYPLFTRL
jgi:hypothetical protein